jgi:hypothetical protein
VYSISLVVDRSTGDLVYLINDTPTLFSFGIFWLVSTSKHASVAWLQAEPKAVRLTASSLPKPSGRI